MVIEPIFDFEKGDFVTTRGGNIQLSTGKEALKTQIEKVLRTARGRFRIYDSTGYGSEVESIFIGKSLPKQYMVAELERAIKEAVCGIDGVTGADGFSVSRDGSRAIVSFTVHSIYGDDERSVTIYG